MQERREARVCLGAALTPIGQLRFTRDGARQFSEFSYAPAWVDDRRAFALVPWMPLGTAPFYASSTDGDARESLPGPLQDVTPDTWGRRLLERAYGSGISEFDILTLSDDLTRQGALRFVDQENRVIAGRADAVPRLIDLDAIRQVAARHEARGAIEPAEIRALAGAGGSLGGARPKANVLDGDTLWIAKFTSIEDGYPVERVEIATLDLARRAGLRVPAHRLLLERTDHPVALIQRFDRRGPGRVPYLSARTALGKAGQEAGSYTEIADFIRAHGLDAAADLRELFSRLVFTILVSNKDDHLKNHGFLYTGRNRWALSPLFDVNPQHDRDPRLETAIMEGEPFVASIDLALEAAEFFGLDQEAARRRVRELAEVVSGHWRACFAVTGVTGEEARRYAGAFEHDAMDRALGLADALGS